MEDNKNQNNSKNDNKFIKGIGSNRLDKIIRKVFKKFDETIKRLS